MGCYNDDILFVHIPKAAGWSVKTYLKEHLPGILMPDDPASKLPIGHVRLEDFERFTGRAPASFKKILAVVRNPYEQQLSQWTFWRDRFARGGRHEHDVTAASYATLSEFLLNPQCDFHLWYEQRFAGNRPGLPVTYPVTEMNYRDFGGLFRFWITLDDEIPENVQVIRSEELDVALPLALRELTGRPMPPFQRRLNSSLHIEDPKPYYTPTAARIVEAKCKWAFDHYYPRWLYSDFA